MADSSISKAAPDLVPARRLGLAEWFVPFGVLLGLVGCLYLLAGPGSAAAGLATLFGYLSLACTFLPLPTAWMLIWASAPAAKGGLGIDPWLAATVGAAATAVANMHDYYLVTFLQRFRPVQRVRRSRLYRRLAAWYRRAPFAALAAASFLPIPVDVVRLLAISEGYPRWRFALGSMVGRWPRYLLLAVLADAFQLGWQWAVGLLGAAACLGLARAGSAVLKRRRPPTLDPAAVTQETQETDE